MKNPFTEKKLNEAIEKWKAQETDLFAETRDRISDEEILGLPSGMKFRNKPIHFDKWDDCWKFTQQTNNYAFA